MSSAKRTLEVECPNSPLFELICRVIAERLPNGRLDCSSRIGVKVIRGEINGQKDQVEMIQAAIHDLQMMLAGLADA